MKHHLNTLFVFTQGTYLRKDSETVVVRSDKKTVVRLPLLNIGSIACFGRIGISPQLMGYCGQNGIAITFMTEQGRFLAAVNGFTPGNVLLRREQYRRADDLESAKLIARSCILGKLSNYRTVLRRGVRDLKESDATLRLERIATRMDAAIRTLSDKLSLDQLRGMEGELSAGYFSVFNDLITSQKTDFVFSGRNRRPPKDSVNAMLSFLYSMLTNDLRSACEAAGLDSAVGFLHRDRPGRPSLALDLMEEFRPLVADSVAISLINRGELGPEDFIRSANGTFLTDSGRKPFWEAWFRRLDMEVSHPEFSYKMAYRRMLEVQARQLWRFVRGEALTYHGFVTR